MIIAPTANLTLPILPTPFPFTLKNGVFGMKAVKYSHQLSPRYMNLLPSRPFDLIGHPHIIFNLLPVFPHQLLMPLIGLPLLLLCDLFPLVDIDGAQSMHQNIVELV